MFSPEKMTRPWSWWGLRALIVSVAITGILSLFDGVLRVPIAFEARGIPNIQMLEIWVSDFRFLFEQGIYASVIFFIGAKFIETRTILSIGFDKLDAGRCFAKVRTKTTLSGSAGAMARKSRPTRLPRLSRSA